MGAGASVPQEGELTLDEVKAIATEAGKEWTEEMEKNFQVNAADGKIAASALASYKEEAAPSDAPADPSSGESNDPVESAPTNDGEAAEAEPTAEEAAESGAAENDEVEGEPAAAEAPTEDPPQQQEPEKPAEDVSTSILKCDSCRTLQ